MDTKAVKRGASRLLKSFSWGFHCNSLMINCCFLLRLKDPIYKKAEWGIPCNLKNTSASFGLGQLSGSEQLFFFFFPFGESNCFARAVQTNPPTRPLSIWRGCESCTSAQEVIFFFFPEQNIVCNASPISSHPSEAKLSSWFVYLDKCTICTMHRQYWFHSLINLTHECTHTHTCDYMY